jgi:hypothetical protein
MKFIERISQDSDAKKIEEFNFLNKENSINLESEILSLKRSISSTKRKLESHKSQHHLSFSDIYEAECEIKLSQAKLKAFGAYKKELF